MTAHGKANHRRSPLGRTKVLAAGGDLQAALTLLACSVQQGHDRLALYRYYYASILARQVLAEYEAYCANVGKVLGSQVAMRLYARADDAVRRNASGSAHAVAELEPTDLS